MARPTIMTEQMIDKLRSAFLIGATDEEACGYAGISKQTLYNYQDKHPEFVDQKEAWKNQPILKAKKTVVDALANPKDAQWYLERKLKNEFSIKTENSLVGEITHNVVRLPDKHPLGTPSRKTDGSTE